MAKKKKVEWIDCSEQELASKLAEWTKSIDLKNTILFLEGEMGAGKSTFARALIRMLAPQTKSAGSPTFPLVQEYQAEDGFLIHHIDLYRLKNEGELADSGIEDEVEQPGLKLIEWGSLFEAHFSHFFKSASQRKSLWVIHIESGSREGTRNYLMTSY